MLTSPRTAFALTRPASRFGLSLVEVVVVLAILVLLLALAMPAIQMMRSSSRQAACLNNLRQLNLATLNYESANQQLPLGVMIPPGGSALRPDELYGWSTDLLPFMEQTPLHEVLVTDAETIVERADGSDRQQVLEALTTSLPGILCPSDETPTLNEHRPCSVTIVEMASSNYVASNNVGICQALRQPLTRQAPVGAFDGIEPTSMDAFADGTSHTLLYSERIYGSFRADQEPAAAGLWYGCRGTGSAVDYTVPGIQDITFAAAGGVNQLDHPDFPGLARHGVSSGHPGWVNVALADGAVKTVSNQVETWYRNNTSWERPDSTEAYGVWERLIALEDGQTVVFE